MKCDSHERRRKDETNAETEAHTDIDYVAHKSSY
jgi:hypothetical protein